ncbi:MAG: hypothetical protein DHS20C19_06440 [Acidimicrobiales bacterium]|nr:MAG: hypothetical protein DHS20C19_06440 [Acidimicrobiales bacterium]
MTPGFERARDSEPFAEAVLTVRADVLRRDRRRTDFVDVDLHGSGLEPVDDRRDGVPGLTRRWFELQRRRGLGSGDSGQAYESDNGQKEQAATHVYTVTACRCRGDTAVVRTEVGIALPGSRRRAGWGPSSVLLDNSEQASSKTDDTPPPGGLPHPLPVTPSPCHTLETGWGAW